MTIKSENYEAETIINDLKKNTIEFVLKKYGLTWKELIYIQSRKPIYQTPRASHISRTKRGNYLVTKTMDKKVINYGEYRARSDAEIIVREMKKIYWNRDKLESVKEKYGIKQYNE